MVSGNFPFHKIENFSSAYCYDVPRVSVVKHKDYFIDDSITIDGDAPKKFIGIYDYRLLGSKHKANRKNWIRYIAKTGHKWYPVESITELLLNRLGTIFGLRMADSQIAMIGGQLRFLSRYFLNPSKEELVHGADILAGFLNEDSPLFVEEVDRQKLTREWFTLQLVENAISSMFLYQKEEIMRELTKLIIFDALVGNNDRHFFNWGVIRSIDGSFQPYFSPVYDTARGLFWNYSEAKLTDIVEVNKTVDSHIRRYCKSSRPKIGWENEKNLNHFSLFEKIYTNEYYISKAEIRALLAPLVLEKMLAEIRQNFHSLMSVNRIAMICKCLEHRLNELKKVL